MNSPEHAAGFTLLEVMVALAILATLSVALYSAAGHIAGTSSALTERGLAQWLADNRLNELRCGLERPRAGLQQERVTFAGREWLLFSETGGARSPHLLRVALDVALPGTPPRQRAHLEGLLEDAP
ncbi:type II secretion system minor pseudopilin GspI [Metapseudomonas furukawaii]|uniref:type II secretion system minor pseudopilin GspI n=1 Tax=Metapseudomonas furukawaii TaxID=1149133 RepID=UPI00211466D7|nr:type II secretion system minor pseudopilin GspI [Pseudomonas sp. A46]